MQDSAQFYAGLSLVTAREGGFLLQLLVAANFFTDYFKQRNQFDSAFFYQGLAVTTKDSLFNQEKIIQFQNIAFAQQMEQEKAEKKAQQYQARVKVTIFFAGIGVLLILAIILLRNNRQKQKANSLLRHQRKEIDYQKAEIEKSLQELKSTQAQLIQSEKMASLGELTAGIAHEIQNPLNFVNNFSEVSNELIDEMKGQLAIGNGQQAIDLADNIKQNLDKIGFHGKRADSIVKGMLQHSRTNSGQKELTDI